MDDCDRAQRLSDSFRDEALARAAERMRGSRLRAVSLICAGCGEIIAPARRAALPATEHCIDCARAIEAAHWRVA